MATEFVRQATHTLDHLRALLVYKTQLASGRFSDLAAGLDNSALAGALAAVARDAEEEKEEIAAVLTDWMRAAAPVEPVVEPSTREVVETWAELQEAAADRLRAAGRAAPTPNLRARLNHLAARDEVHARLLRSLL